MANGKKRQRANNSFSDDEQQGDSDIERQNTDNRPYQAERKRELERNRRNLINVRFQELDQELQKDIPNHDDVINLNSINNINITSSSSLLSNNSKNDNNNSNNNTKSKRIDKEAVLKDACLKLASQRKDLHSLIQRIKSMTEEISNLRAEKIELRNDKSYLRSELETARSELPRLRTDNIQLWQHVQKLTALKMQIAPDITKIPIQLFNNVSKNQNTSNNTNNQNNSDNNNNNNNNSSSANNVNASNNNNSSNNNSTNQQNPSTNISSMSHLSNLSVIPTVVPTYAPTPNNTIDLGISAARPSAANPISNSNIDYNAGQSISNDKSNGNINSSNLTTTPPLSSSLRIETNTKVNNNNPVTSTAQISSQPTSHSLQPTNNTNVNQTEQKSRDDQNENADEVRPTVTPTDRTPPLVSPFSFSPLFGAPAARNSFSGIEAYGIHQTPEDIVGWFAALENSNGNSTNQPTTSQNANVTVTDPHVQAIVQDQLQIQAQIQAQANAQAAIITQNSKALTQGNLSEHRNQTQRQQQQQLQLDQQLLQQRQQAIANQAARSLDIQLHNINNVNTNKNSKNFSYSSHDKNIENNNNRNPTNTEPQSNGMMDKGDNAINNNSDRNLNNITISGHVQIEDGNPSLIDDFPFNVASSSMFGHVDHAADGRASDSVDDPNRNDGSPDVAHCV